MTDQIVNSVLIALALASAGFWIRCIAIHRNQLCGIPGDLVPRRDRRKPFWNAGDALVMFGIMQIIAGTIAAILIQRGIIIPKPFGEAPALTIEQTSANQFAMLWVGMIGGGSAFALMLIWLRARNRDAFRDLGFHFTLADVRLGLKAALMILPPVLLVSVLVSTLVQYEHPVLDILKDIESPGRLAMIFWATAVVTPLIEEFLFRVLLIGGLERLMSTGRSINHLPETDAMQGADYWQPTTFWPIVISSFIFAIMHFGQGAAPIPLFFLALGLGYLYRRTGSITAPLMVLNAMTLVVETIRLNS